jgi:hypothetical protein
MLILSVSASLQNFSVLSISKRPKKNKSGVIQTREDSTANYTTTNKVITPMLRNFQGTGEGRGETDGTSHRRPEILSVNTPPNNGPTTLTVPHISPLKPVVSEQDGVCNNDQWARQDVGATEACDGPYNDEGGLILGVTPQMKILTSSGDVDLSKRFKCPADKSKDETNPLCDRGGPKRARNAKLRSTSA